MPGRFGENIPWYYQVGSFIWHIFRWSAPACHLRLAPATALANRDGHVDGGDECVEGGDEYVEGGDECVEEVDEWVEGGGKCAEGGDKCVESGDECFKGVDESVEGGHKCVEGGDESVEGGMNVSKQWINCRNHVIIYHSRLHKCTIPVRLIKSGMFSCMKLFLWESSAPIPPCWPKVR